MYTLGAIILVISILGIIGWGVVYILTNIVNLVDCERDRRFR